MNRLQSQRSMVTRPFFFGCYSYGAGIDQYGYEMIVLMVHVTGLLYVCTEYST